MTNGSGDDLLHWRLAARQAKCVVFRGEVSDQRGYTILRPQERQSLFEEGGLTRARTGNKAHDKDTLRAEPVAQRPGDDVILLQNVLTHFQQARFGNSSRTSRAVISSSFPWTTSEVGVPHSGQQNHCIEVNIFCALQAGQ